MSPRRRLALPVAVLAAGLIAGLLGAARARGAAAGAELLRNGEEAFAAGRFEDAVEAFAGAAQAEPAADGASAALARAQGAWGVSLVRAGRVRESIEHFEKAAAAEPESAVRHLQLAMVLARVRDLAGARRAVDRALELRPDDPAAREVSGDVSYQEGLLGRAVGEWETAAKAPGAGRALAAKIDRGRREMDAEEGMGSESSRHFVVRYDREVPRELVRGFFTVLDRAYDALHDRLGDYPRDDIQVILYSGAAFGGVTRAASWVGGLYDGKIRVPVGGLTTAREAEGLLGVLVHEMTHAFLFRMAPYGLPLWFEEGLATAYQGLDPALVREGFAHRRPEGLETLEDVDRALRGEKGDVVTAYAAARLAVADVEEARGPGGIRAIVGEVGKGTPFAEAFERETRLTLAEFEERWRRDLR